MVDMIASAVMNLERPATEKAGFRPALSAFDPMGTAAS
jgi:hypothetical protein